MCSLVFFFGFLIKSRLSSPLFYLQISLMQAKLLLQKKRPNAKLKRIKMVFFSVLRVRNECRRRKKTYSFPLSQAKWHIAPLPGTATSTICLLLLLFSLATPAAVRICCHCRIAELLNKKRLNLSLKTFLFKRYVEQFSSLLWMNAEERKREQSTNENNLI